MTSATVTPVHLWAEGDNVRWWTPEATGQVSATLPPAGQAAARLEPGQRALRECLPDALAEVLIDALPGQLILAENLPGEWSTLPWETLLVDGRPLLGRLGVTRYAPWPDLPDPLCPEKIGLMDLFAPKERWFRGHDTLACRNGAIRHLAAGDLTDLGVLVIATHGRRQGDMDEPFVAHDGEPWGLPLARHFPPVVLLLACGDDHGGLLDYARRLLARGTRAVLAPRGELNGEQAAAFLGRFRQRWEAGSSLATMLREMQADHEQYHGAARLQLLGDGDCAAYTPAPDPATQLVAITLAGYRRPGGWCLEHTLERFRDRRNLPDASFGSPDGVAALLHEIRKVEANLPRLTRRWVLSLLAYLAEIRHDHGLLAYLQRARTGIIDPQHADPLDYYHWHKLHYRRGQYGAAFQELATSLQLARDRDHETYTRLLGGLCNCFIDINLARPAQRICEFLDDALYGQSSEAEEQRFKLGDRQARAAMRQGALGAAIHHYRNKRTDAIRLRKEDGLREDSGLLQALAWHAPDDTETRDLVHRLLAKIQTQEETELYGGNTLWAYLLQSLGLWAWRASDTPTHDAVRQLFLRDPRPLDGRDAGPVGMATAYLLLHSRDTRGNTAPLQDHWEQVRHAMAQQGYWLELAALYCFLDDHDNCQEALRRFQQRRRPVLERSAELLAGWLEEGIPGVSHWRDWLELLEVRERAVLRPGVHPGEVAREGLMPL